MSEADTITVDCSQLAWETLYGQLRSSNHDKNWLLVGGDRQHAAAFSGSFPSGSIVVNFSLGDFVGLMGRLSHLEVDGNVGAGCGASLVSGTLLVKRNAGNFLAAHASGGLVATLGTAGDYAGFGLSGGDVFVRSRVGDFAGYEMASGTLVLGNGAGTDLGKGATGGVIYVRGEVGSVSPDVKLFRLKDPDLMRLTLLLARAGIKSDGKDFKAYRPKVGSR